MKRAGDSCDWSRERFTLDPGLSRAVREAFVRLYEKGLIYRGQLHRQLVPALPDRAVGSGSGARRHAGPSVAHRVSGERQFDEAGGRDHAAGDDAGRYRGRDQSERSARRRSWRGKTVRLPLMDRDIPIILDEMAELGFGSGAVKITPAHDPNDFEAGKRHNLPSIQVIDGNAQDDRRGRQVRRPGSLSKRASRWWRISKSSG